MTPLLDMRTSLPDGLRRSMRESARQRTIDGLRALVPEERQVIADPAALTAYLLQHGYQSRESTDDVMALGLHLLTADPPPVDASRLEFVSRRLQLAIDAYRDRAAVVDEALDLAYVGLFLGLIYVPLAARAELYPLAWQLAEKWLAEADRMAQGLRANPEPTADCELGAATLAEVLGLLQAAWMMLVSGLTVYRDLDLPAAEFEPVG